MDILKIAAIAMCAVVIITLVRTYKPEFSIFVSLGCSIIILYFLVDSLKYGFLYVAGVYEKLIHGREYFIIIIKILGVAYITEFTAQLCIDSGEKSISSKVELAGKIIIFYLAIPIFMSILDLLNNLL